MGDDPPPPPSTSSSPLAPPPPGVTRVLFCGREMHYGWLYTQQAAAANPAVEVLQCDRGDARAAVRYAHVAVPLMTRLDAATLADATAAAGAGLLRHVIQFGVGVEGVDLASAASAGVSVHRIPSSSTANAPSCAEMAIYLALALLRRAPELAASVATRRLGAPPGRTLTGKAALVVGYGGIARELVPRLAALGVVVDGVRRSAWGEGEEGARLLRRRGAWSDLAPFAADADIVFVTCAQNPDTVGVIGPSFWAAVAEARGGGGRAHDGARRGLAIINVARGGLVDPTAALAALDTGLCAGLGLDVQWEEPVAPDHPLVTHPRVVVTPHVAGVTEESYRGMAAIVAADAGAVAAGGRPASELVNGPVAGWVS